VVMLVMQTILSSYLGLVESKDITKDTKQLKSDNKCSVDEDCDDENLEMCCFDLSTPSTWTNDQKGWRKTCCNNLSGSPIIEPPANLTQPQMDKLDKGISSLAPMFMDSVVCEGLPYPTMIRLPSCQAFTTTTEMPSKLQQTSGVSVTEIFLSIISSWTGVMIMWHFRN